MCFCGVKRVFLELCSEFELGLGFKLSTHAEMRMHSTLWKLYHKHGTCFEQAQFRRRASLNGTQSQKNKLSPIQTILRKYKTHTTMTADEQRIFDVAQGLADQLFASQCRKELTHDPQAAWLGDMLNDAYLAVAGVQSNLSAKQMDNIRQKILSASGLAGKLGRAVAEDVEAQVGRAAKPHLTQLRQMLKPIVNLARTPLSGETVLKRLDAAVAAEMKA